MRITPFKAYLPDLNKIRFDDAFYRELREHFNPLFKQGAFRPLNTPCYFVLEITDHGLRSTGLITMTDIRDFLNHKILKHEQTITNKEKLHDQLISQRKAMIKPAALLIENNAPLQRMLGRLKKKSEPVFKISYPDVETTHALWVIDQPEEVRLLTALFAQDINKAIIADGHHRFATWSSRYLRSGKQNHHHILTVYFTRNQLRVSGFFRIVEKLKAFTHSGILNAIKQHCTYWRAVDRIVPEKGFIHLMVDQEKYRFKLKSNTVALPLPLVFRQEILGPVFKIRDETKSKRIFYAESTDHLSLLNELAQSHPGKYIFILPDLTARDILNNKKVLPPKSTFFLPRIINGLVIAIDPMDNRKV